MSGPPPTPLTHAEVLGRYVGAFVDELVACGLEDVCLCPGSRSTPLAIAFARHPKIKLWTHLDERSCAYFALGMQKGWIKRVAILCSSGTAAVNFAPAIVESSYSGWPPLLVLTADRPPELQDVGANQTIDQNRLYGSAVKWFVNMPLPDASEEALRHVRMVASRAFFNMGPVHLNFPFREPLVPAPYEPKVLRRSLGGHAKMNYGEYPAAPSRDLARELRKHQRGVIVCGQMPGAFAWHITPIAEKLGFPILADALSNVRCDTQGGPTILGSYDAFLRMPEVAEALKPDLILRFGDPPTSKPLATYLARHRDVKQIQVTLTNRWIDPDITADQIVRCEPKELCDELDKRLKPRTITNDWLATWQHLEAAAVAAMGDELKSSTDASEVTAVIDLADVLPAGYNVFAGNSMPVRDVDSFWPAKKQHVRFLANRGASGIDGVVSTALGASAVSPYPVVLVIGDLSFYHDMNGLLAAKRFGINATIVLINNDGGGIFSFLPQHEAEPEHFETLFGTPHGLDFAPVAQLYGVGFQRVTTREEYRAALKASFEAPGVQVIEIKTDRDENLALHQRIWQAVAKALRPEPVEGVSE